jgi:hypothetical protein
MGTRRVTLITCVVASTISSDPEKTATKLPGGRVILLENGSQSGNSINDIHVFAMTANAHE